MSDQQTPLALLKEDKRVIIYRPRLSRMLGTTPAILLQQIHYWYNDKPFYKYRSPCNADAYKVGDSWCEELGFSESEFDTALRHIGTKCTKKAIEDNDGKKPNVAVEAPDIPLPTRFETRRTYTARLREVFKLLVFYWTDNNRQTWYELNLPLFGKLITSIYQDKLDISIYLVNGESAFTFLQDTTHKTTTKEKDLPPQVDGDITVKNCIYYKRCSDGRSFGTDRGCVGCGRNTQIVDAKQVDGAALVFEYGNSNSEHKVPSFILIDGIKYLAIRTEHGHIKQDMRLCNCGSGFGDEQDNVFHTLYAVDDKTLAVCLMCQTFDYGESASKCCMCGDDKCNPYAVEAFGGICICDNKWQWIDAGCTGYPQRDASESARRLALDCENAGCIVQERDNLACLDCNGFDSNVSTIRHSTDGSVTCSNSCGVIDGDYHMVDGKPLCAACWLAAHERKGDDLIDRDSSLTAEEIQHAADLAAQPITDEMAAALERICRGEFLMSSVDMRVELCHYLLDTELIIVNGIIDVDEPMYLPTDKGRAALEAYQTQQNILHGGDWQAAEETAKGIALNCPTMQLGSCPAREDNSLACLECEWQKEFPSTMQKSDDAPVADLAANVAPSQQYKRDEPRLPINDDVLIDDPPPPPKARKPRKPKRTPEQKQADDNMFEAVKHVWKLNDNAAWKIQKFKKFLLGKIASSKADKRYGDVFKNCQLNDPEGGLHPAIAQEVVAFGHWYRSTYDDMTIPEKGDTLLNHFQSFRGSDKWESFMRKAERTIADKIPNIKLPGAVEKPPEPAEEEYIEMTPERIKQMNDLMDGIGRGGVK